MNKTALYVIGAIIVVGGIVWMMSGNAPSRDEGMSGDNSEAAREASSGMATGKKTSLKALLASGTSEQCTFAEKNDVSESSGTVYVANGKMRGDFVSLASGASIESHMIVESNTGYVWSSAMPQGVKMSLDAMNSNDGTDSSQSVDLNEELDYECASWSADQSMFALPKGITFMDIGAMMQ